MYFLLDTFGEEACINLIISIMPKLEHYITIKKLSFRQISSNVFIGKKIKIK